jgi:hypothetical protein
MINPTRTEINKIFSKIDKIAKKGNDSYMEYHILVDNLIRQNKYYYLLECLQTRYEYDATYQDVPTIKKQSWKDILFRTNTTLQDFKRKLFKSKGVYQQGLFYYKEIPLTTAKVIDLTGSGCELRPLVQNGSVVDVKVFRTGSNYSASASIVITGGTATASATPIIRGGKIFLANVTATGSGHNQSLKLGKIEEKDVYEVAVNNKFTNDIYQRIISNKTTYLLATKEGEIQGVSFSTWNTNFNYDKNLSNLYTQAVNYLLS